MIFGWKDRGDLIFILYCCRDPFPPRRWARETRGFHSFDISIFEKVTTTSSFGMVSVGLNSPIAPAWTSNYDVDHHTYLWSQGVPLRWSSSSLWFRGYHGVCDKDLFSLSSSSIFFCSRPASFWSCISRIAVACFSLSAKFCIRLVWASSLVLTLWSYGSLHRCYQSDLGVTSRGYGHEPQPLEIIAYDGRSLHLDEWWTLRAFLSGWRDEAGVHAPSEQSC